MASGAAVIPAAKTKVLAISLDWDGCVANSKFITALKAEPRDKLVSNERFIELLKIHNPGLKEHLLSLVKVESPDHMVFMIGSNRQSAVIEDDNSFGNGYGCFPYFKDFVSSFLEPELSTLVSEGGHKVQVSFNPVLLADISHGLRHGTALTDYNAAQAEGQAPRFDHCELPGINDELKTGLVMAQMHLVAEQYPNSAITYALYDDKHAILEAVHEFCKDQPHILPKEVALSVYRYQGAYTGLRGQEIYMPVVPSSTLGADPLARIVGMGEVIKAEGLKDALLARRGHSGESVIGGGLQASSGGPFSIGGVGSSGVPAHGSLGGGGLGRAETVAPWLRVAEEAGNAAARLPGPHVFNP